MNQKVLYILIAVCLLIFAGIAVVLWQDSRRKKGYEAVKRKRGRNHLYYVYRFFNAFPITRRYFNKFQARLSSLYPADQMELNRMTTGVMLRALLISAACFGILLFFCKGDLFFILISFLMVYVVFTNSVTNSVDRLDLKLLKQLSDFITDCRSNYHTVGMVDDAVYMTLDRLPTEIGLHINRIYEVITSTDVAAKAEEYADVAPNRFLKVFATTCATIVEYGDKKLDSGESLFLKNLEYIKEEIYIEINKIEKNNFLFSGLILVSLMPIFALKPIEAWASTIEEMKSFYTGPAGMIVMVMVFISAFVCYELISNLKEGKAQEDKEHRLLERIARLPVLRRYLTKYVNANYTRCLRYGDNLKMTGDHISPQAFFLQRLAFGTMLAFCVLVISITATIVNKHSILHDFTGMFEESIVPDEEYRKTMQEAGETYLNRHKKIEDTPETRKELSTEIQENENIRSDLADSIADVIVTRAGQYSNSYFKWYNILIMIAAFGIGLFIPVWYLMYKMTIMRMSMEDEVAQFRSLALILMHVDGMTLDVILEWMERFSNCFRQSISECIINLEQSPATALEKMRDNESFPPFIRFCDNLLNIDNVGVAAAFDEVVTEQINYKEQRKLNNEIVSNKRSNMGKLITFVPMGICIVGYLILPFVIMSWNMMSTMSEAFQF